MVTAVIFTVVVTWTTTTTATPTTTAGPANKGEARWVRHAAMRALIRIEEEAHEKSSLGLNVLGIVHKTTPGSLNAAFIPFKPNGQSNAMKNFSWHSNHKRKF